MRFVSVQINTALTVVSAIGNTFYFNFKVCKTENNHTRKQTGSATRLIALDILVVSLKDMEKKIFVLMPLCHHIFKLYLFMVCLKEQQSRYFSILSKCRS